MAINKKLIHFKLKSSFETELANNNILDTSIVFIQETKEIWTHGQLYKCSDPDLSNYVKESELQELLSPIQSSLANKLEASALEGYAKTSDIPAAVTDSTVINWGFMKTSDANETYAPKSLVETVSNQATTISTLATKDELSTGLSGKANSGDLAAYVPTTRTINGTALTDDIWITATDPNAATKEELNGLATTVANKAEASALANYATNDALSSGLSGKQETLVSGTNIKTIEGKSILGSGDIQITAAEVGAYTTGQVDEKVTALNNAISGKVDPSTVTAVSDRVSTLEGYFSTAEDSDATINKWGEIVNFLDGVAEGSNIEQLLAAKANQSALDNLSTTVNTHIGNSSVSKDGETLTVTINGVSQSLTNTDTWRSISDSVNGDRSYVSASEVAVASAYSWASTANATANTANTTANTVYSWGNHANAGYQSSISDLSSIRSNASAGYTAYTWGNHANAGYASQSELNNLSSTVNSHGAKFAEYLPTAGGTVTGNLYLNGSLNLANGVMNNIGDDAAIGDINEAGTLGLQAINSSEPGIRFIRNDGVKLGKISYNDSEKCFKFNF